MSIINYIFIDEISLKGTAIKYIDFLDEQYRLSSEQKDILKEICNGYFFYSKTKKLWGFTNRGQNELNVANFLNTGVIPGIVNKEEISHDKEIVREQLPFNIENFKFEFYAMHGRPLFHYESKEDFILIYINLSHWFFIEKNEIEMQFAKKIVLSLVGAKLEFTSKTVESFFTKLDSIQSNLKYDYGNSK